MKTATQINPSIAQAQSQRYLSEVRALITTEARRGMVMANVRGWCDSKRHNIKLKNGFETACWAYHNNQHHIYIGDAIFGAVKASADGAQYVKALLNHELAHAMWTDRDMASVKNAIDAGKVPFSLFNLFEDARIEHAWRKMTAKFFDWQSMNKPFDIVTPIQSFFAFVFFEGDVSKINWEGDIQLVGEFYQRCCDAKSTLDVIHICKDWIEVFGDDCGDLPDGMPASMGETGEQSDDESQGEQDDESTQDEGDLIHAVIVSENASLGDLEDDAVQIQSTPSREVEGDGISANTQDSESQNLIKANEQLFTLEDDLMSDAPHGYDREYANLKAVQIKRVFYRKSRYRPSDKPSKRLNPKLLSGNKDVPMYRRKKLLAKDNLKVNLIIDCSGSMYGEPMQNANQVCATFNRLAQMGMIDCKVILSRSGISKYPNINLPVSDDTVDYIGNAAGGHGESLEQCFKAHLKDMQRAKYNFVITDGELTDGDIRKPLYQSRGIFTTGLYVCSGNRENDLVRWFDKGIVCSNLETLFANMILELKKR